MSIKVLFALAVTALAGCSSSSFNPYPYGKIKTEEGVGSFIQWNEDYAITAKHVRYQDGVVHVCETGCDLKFFKHKAGGSIPQWRDRVPNEEVAIVGTSTSSFSKLKRGHDMSMPVIWANGDPNVYYATTASAVHGMSGGPVYGEDKKVIGMTLAISDYPVNGEMKRITIYLPYALVQHEWDKYSGRSSREMLAVDTGFEPVRLLYRGD